jgi:hypothetical protein
MKYLAPDAEPDAGRDERELEGLMDLVQPGWRRLVHERRFFPAIVVTHALPAATLGGKRGRPSTETTGIGGLYLAGDWVGDTGLLADGAVASARAAAERCHAYLAARTAEAA